MNVTKSIQNTSNSFSIRFKKILPSFNSVPSKRKQFGNDVVNLVFRKESVAPSEVWSSHDKSELPNYSIISLSTLDSEIIAFKSGPDCGIDFVEGLFAKKKMRIDSIRNKHKQRYSFEKHFDILDKKVGSVCVSLYERNPLNGKLSGEPIADSFLVSCRANNSILIVADGVNWGRQAKVASRCAVYACYRHLEQRLFNESLSDNFTYSTQDVLCWIREAIDTAQQMIVDSGTPGLTTICVAVVLPTAKEYTTENQSGGNTRFAVCCVNVGDSLAFLISKSNGIREITVGSHMSVDQRDFRDTGGALGKVHDSSPELNNLTYSLTLCDQGDIVLLTTDGVTDNFDPVVNKIAMPTTNLFPFIDSCPSCYPDSKSASLHQRTVCTCRCQQDEIQCRAVDVNFSGKLELGPSERQHYAIKQIERVWHDTELHVSSFRELQRSQSMQRSHSMSKPKRENSMRIKIEEESKQPSSHELCQSIMEEVFKVTADKRRFLEKQYVIMNNSESKSGNVSNSETNSKNSNNDNNNSADTTITIATTTNQTTKKRGKLCQKSHSTAGNGNMSYDDSKDTNHLTVNNQRQQSGKGFQGDGGGGRTKLRHQKTMDCTDMIVRRQKEMLDEFSTPPSLPPPLDVNLIPWWKNIDNNKSENDKATSISEQQRKKSVPPLLRSIHPGKLDHATVVACEAGDWSACLTPNGYHYPL